MFLHKRLDKMGALTLINYESLKQYKLGFFLDGVDKTNNQNVDRTKNTQNVKKFMSLIGSNQK